MNGGVNFDISDLVAYKSKWERFQKAQDDIIRKILTDLAIRTIREIIFDTPVDEGTLRMGWITETHEEAYAKKQSANNITEDMIKESLTISKDGTVYIVKITNAVKHARPVEYGHRVVRNGVTVGYVNGVLMMTTSIAKVQAVADQIIQASWDRIVKEYGL